MPPVLFSTLLALSPQLVPAGDEGAPAGLTVVTVDVGQGSAAVLRTPDGAVHVFDAGPEGQGAGPVSAAIRGLSPARYGFTFLSHYDVDHSGGMDEVLLAFPFQLAWDRGDERRPSGGAVTRYLSAAGSRRRTAAAGQVVDLGGGVQARVVAVNGRVEGGASVPVRGQPQEENARCLALRVDYGDFSMWIGGDLTGGGFGTPDVESPASAACGDVDVYVVDHHGSSTSSNGSLVQRLRPELALVSCGAGNPFGHPHVETINGLNRRAASATLVSTTTGAGKLGYSVAGTFSVATDGRRYRLSSQGSGFLDYLVDEAAAPGPAPGDVVVSELHRDPSAVADANGEYLELTNVSAVPLPLGGVEVSGAGGSFTLAGGLVLYPGRPVAVCADGDPARNGGLPLAHTWPFSALALGNAVGSVGLRAGGRTLDQVVWSGGFAGGPGVAAARVDLLGPPSAANFAPAPNPYGKGDRGSPGRRNAVDATRAPARLAVEASPGEVVLRASALSDGGKLSVAAMAFGTSPGFPLLGRTVPLNPDGLFGLSLTLPGAVALLPTEGYRSFAVPLPVPSPLFGVRAFAAHVVLDLRPPSSVAALSPAVPFVFP